MNILALLPPDVKIHPLSHVYDNQLILYVAKSTSANMPLVLNMLQQANEFDEIRIGNKPIYIGVFALTKDKLPLVFEIIKIVGDWKGFSMFLNQQYLDRFSRTYDVLSCYYQALLCHDHKAYCNLIYEDRPNTLSIVISLNPQEQEEKPIEKWLIPCRKLYYSHNRISELHPSSIEHQLQALAVERNCHWCPFFSIEDYKKIN